MVSRFYKSQQMVFCDTLKKMMMVLSEDQISKSNTGQLLLQKRINGSRDRYLCVPRKFIDDADDVDNGTAASDDTSSVNRR